MNDFAERTVFMKDYFWEKERNIDGKLFFKQTKPFFNDLEK